MKVAPIISLIVIFAISCHADLSFVTTGTSNSAAVTKKLNKVNSVISAIVSPSFVKKTTQAIASQDSTIKTLIVAIYNIPVMGFGCLSASGMKILNNLETGATTSANISDAFAAACPLWKSKVNDVVNAAAAFKAKYSNQSPEIVANLPTSIQNALSTLNNATTSILSNGASFKNNTFLKDSVNSLVEKVKTVTAKEWKKFSSSVPWLGPVVNKKGNYNTNFNNALDLVKDGVENGFNTIAIAEELTPLSTVPQQVIAL
uniref:Secreted protein n=1 Tax=Panagrellus redivivus TaxID=6233 RepID=A0A7E4V2M8_PANRE